jgi:hypothetical protein
MEKERPDMHYRLDMTASIIEKPPVSICKSSHSGLGERNYQQNFRFDEARAVALVDANPFLQQSGRFRPMLRLNV